MTRRLLMLLPLAACVAADAEKEAAELIAEAVSGLSAGKPEVFLEAFDASIPGFSKLRDAIVGLITQAELSCSLEVVSNEGDGAARTLTIDWILRMERKDGNAGSLRRQKTVTCRMKKQGRHWRIVSFDPLDLFAGF